MFLRARSALPVEGQSRSASFLAKFFGSSACASITSTCVSLWPSPIGGMTPALGVRPEPLRSMARSCSMGSSPAFVACTWRGWPRWLQSLAPSSQCQLRNCDLHPLSCSLPNGPAPILTKLETEPGMRVLRPSGHPISGARPLPSAHAEGPPAVREDEHRWLDVAAQDQEFR